MKKVYIPLLVCFSLLIVGCSRSIDSPVPQDSTPQVSLIQQRFVSPNYAGDYVAAEQTDKKHAIDLVVTPGGFDTNPIQLVVAGQFDIGIAGVDAIANANERGANLVIIGTPSYRNPTCFISKSEKNIITPQDFIGKTIGTLEGTSSHLVYQELMRAAGVQRSDVIEVSAPFELTSFIATDAYDVRPAFCNDETVQLELQNISYNTVDPQNYGVDLAGIVYFARQSRVQNNPDLVQNTINSLVDGRDTVRNSPETGINAVQKYDDKADVEYISRALNIGNKQYYGGENDMILFISPERIYNTLSIMKSYNLIDSIPEDIVDMSFVEQSHNR